MEDYFKRNEKISLIDNTVSDIEKTKILSFSLILAIFLDRFFIEKDAGVSVLIFVILCLGIFLCSVKDRGKALNNIVSFEKKNLMRTIILLSVIFIAGTFALFSNEVLAFLNIIFVIIGFAFYCVLSTNKKDLEKMSYVKAVLKRLIPRSFENTPKPFVFLNKFIKSRKKVETNSEIYKVLKGILIALPVLAIILVLLSSADMMFSYYLIRMFGMFGDIKIASIILHSVIIVAAFLYIFGFLWSFKYEGIYEDVKEEWSLRFEALTIMPIFVILNIVYVLFTAVQFSYLYGGGNALLPENFTYAEYARRGFFELVTVAIINFTIILCAMKFTKKQNGKIEKLNKIFMSFLIVFTINMLFSAHYKMSLYEATYGYTYLRVFVHIFMLLIFILFIIVFLGIWTRKVAVGKLCLITSVLMYVILNYINVDIFIVKKNLELSGKTQKLDMTYLANLSYDTIPYMVDFCLNNNSEKSNNLRRELEEKKSILLDTDYNWYEFNLSRYKGEKALKRLNK
ncbi:DUF4173 domain-containing protein [Clostridium sp. PL3]|uniref:DUF4173 domain-containing protein n=1 Tax=Clostridium thailandense TaxID=2794346 RepID=A0A949U1F1_9CLOT|nr:DUF4173 domain-containing protein [Clostridium thailandense]MBV7276608.1 DUF4173 domain-containing protein [Clostridium thailandense]